MPGSHPLSRMTDARRSGVSKRAARFGEASGSRPAVNPTRAIHGASMGRPWGRRPKSRGVAKGHITL